MNSSFSSTTIYERDISRSRGEVSLSAFSYLFSEIVQYSQNRVVSVSDLISRLEELGYNMGQRAFELLSIRERAARREIRLVSMLQYVSTVFWKFCFNKAADNLEKSIQNEDECKQSLSSMSYSFLGVVLIYTALFLCCVYCRYAL